MSGDNRAEVLHWVGKARSDRLNVENNLASERVPWDTICFHCQQASEKLLKAALVMAGADVPRTHDLLDLARRCTLVHPRHDWRSLAEPLGVLNPYAVMARHGDPPFEEGESEGREAYAAMLAVWQSLDSLVGLQA